MDGIAFETEGEIREGWATHFQRLATPLQSNKFDNEYKDMVDADVEIISTLCEAEDRPITPIREKEVIASMKRLKNNKAVDVMRLTSEHFKLGGCSLIDFPTALLNNLISAKRVSAVLKEGILTPIFKKGDTSDPGNYRGITVNPVLLKILEHILITRHNDIFYSTQSRLQRGFTGDCSSLNAAVILTECLLETVNNTSGSPHWIHRRHLTSFDVVDHRSL